MVRNIDEQLNVLRMADYEGLPLNRYVNEHFTAREMLVILDGLRQNLDVSCFANNKFNYKQMYEIMEGIQDGIDVKPLLDPSITWKEMEYLKLLIKRGVNVTPLIKDHLTPNQLAGILAIMDSANPDKLMHMAKSFNYDIRMIEHALKFNLTEKDFKELKYNTYGLNWTFEPEQVAIILKTSILGHSIVNYVFPEMRTDEMLEIADAVENGIDVRQFALPGYTCEQMHFIRQCLEEGKDVTYILKPDLSVEEMENIIG